jgi:hypothetical protein
MNHEKMAREIDDAIAALEVESTFGNRRPLTKHEREDIIAAKLKELFPMSEDLEAAVREAVHEIWRSEHLTVQESFDDYEQSSEDWQARLTPYILPAVASLLAERDERIEKLRAEVDRQKKRCSELTKPNFPT